MGWNFRELTVANTGIVTFEKIYRFSENTCNILNVSNKKVQVDLKIVCGKWLSIEEIE